MVPTRNYELFPDARRDLAYISEVVSAALDGVESEWTEVVREFEDERNYLSISVATRFGEDAPTVQIEFGVQDTEKRHATGGLVAGWSRDRSCIEGLEIILIDGKPCDISQFADHLAHYVKLPSTVQETSVRDTN